MKIACYDGYYRKFIPSQGVASHLKISIAKTTRAYCDECGNEFRAIETERQKEDWRNHICESARLNRVPIEKLKQLLDGKPNSNKEN